MLTPLHAENGSLSLSIEGTKAVVTLSVALTVDGNVPALWIEDLRGTVGFRPKENMDLMRGVLRDCERIARGNGCREMRIEANSRASWKKELWPKLGFTPHRVGTLLVMRKALADG